MNEIPEILLCDIIEFVDAKTLPYLRETCRNFLRSFNKDDRWKQIYEENSDKNKLSLIKCNSVCITALTLREYKSSRVCFICECNGLYVSWNEFYDLLVCKRCEKHSFLKTSGFKTACTHFQLKWKGNQNQQ